MMEGEESEGENRGMKESAAALIPLRRTKS